MTVRKTKPQSLDVYSDTSVSLGHVGHGRRWNVVTGRNEGMVKAGERMNHAAQRQRVAVALILNNKPMTTLDYIIMAKVGGSLALREA